METTECTEPDESYNDPDKIKIPDFSFKNIDSVKKCLQAAGWHYDPQKVDENTYGEGTVMEQYPAAGDDADPKDMPNIILKVSTGDPASAVAEQRLRTLFRTMVPSSVPGHADGPGTGVPGPSRAPSGARLSYGPAGYR